MRNFRIFGIAFLALALFAVSASAQKKTAKKPTTKKPAPTTNSSTKIVPPLDVRAGREKVDIQLSNVNDFVNMLGTIAQGLEIADADAKAGKLRPATASKIDAKKKEIVAAIRNMSVVLRGLESEFRTKAALQKYLPQIEKISDLSTESEDLAIAGKFVAAKEPLRNVAKKLTDTLAAMPL